MNGIDLELEIRRDQLNAQSLNCSHLLQSGYAGQLDQAWCGQAYLQGSPCLVGQCTCPALGDYEISIQQIGQEEPLLNYGAKLRLIMADPLKGIDLREAIAKLKSALKQCKNEH
jgi:hypothetical protein